MHQNGILPGRLYLLILKTLACDGELHGYEVANWTEHASVELLQGGSRFALPALLHGRFGVWLTSDR